MLDLGAKSRIDLFDHLHFILCRHLLPEGRANLTRCQLPRSLFDVPQYAFTGRLVAATATLTRE